VRGMAVIAGLLGMMVAHPYSAPWSVHVRDFAIGYFVFLGLRGEVAQMIERKPEEETGK
jgi:hypothetical protein